MERADLLEQARQGDPRAIAAILNQQLKYRAIECRALVTDSLLHLILQAEEETPELSHLLDAIRAKLINLDIDGLARVRLYGLAPEMEIAPQTIPEAPAWTHEFALAVGGYSILISESAHEKARLTPDTAESDRDAEPATSPQPHAIPHRTKKQPTPFSLAVVAVALGLVVVSGYRLVARNSRSAPPSDSTPDSVTVPATPDP